MIAQLNFPSRRINRCFAAEQRQHRPKRRRTRRRGLSPIGSRLRRSRASAGERLSSISGVKR